MEETDTKIELEKEELEEISKQEIKKEGRQDLETLEITKEILALDEKAKQTLFDSLISAISNSQNRDTILYLTFAKAYKILRETGIRFGTIETDTEFSNRVQSLSAQDRQALFDSVISATFNQNSRDTILHILFWKAEKLLTESSR
ncbi:hypothetical protein [Leptospira weilii]|uniref:Uncharacterized protein n=1 Tax=Leptospira weilii str. UI 13098 TaxID=1088542 RepID=M6Q3K8_9LEPT|nr:hypothetical protein [Leptospira weilii]EMN89884.1 hypothetical protein LEP1GSC108_3397 [Leptospira weilii str. UI 13098]OMI16729.1 hypothetical protein BUQ74_14155 [Leptospira weilii serovar Heyan]